MRGAFLRPRGAALKAAAAAVALSASLLSGCGSSDDTEQAPGNHEVMDKSWQVIGIYTTPDGPSTIPDSVPIAPSMTFGSHGIVGTSGCAQFRARASYFRGTEDAAVNDADNLRIDGIEWDSTRDGCTGESLWAHNQIVRLITEDSAFDMKVDTVNQLILTLRTDAVDSPAIRFASLNKVSS